MPCKPDRCVAAAICALIEAIISTYKVRRQRPARQQTTEGEM